MEVIRQRPQWILLSLGSGVCAALNGVFAKLGGGALYSTTSQLTTQWVNEIVRNLGLEEFQMSVEITNRVIFFVLNLILNGIMWTLFTRALARGTSTTRVSILNTTSNFMATAVLGWVIFSETLPALWFVGAAFLIVGNVIIGRGDDKESEIQL
ncbi:hypothetical protein GcM3_092002 [Golovinomyces cichoracearum]|uniref:Transmembrane protein 42 n=1 Tax=Golovinomyces cichoracearum TaxID=62708 RepID=A0A420IH60_9PEZI|nr:hypothetical protein GcM3_092002 [Golovinomyces cichoracearum]